MTDTIINFSANQSASNLLLSESDIQTLIDASVLAAIPTFSNATNYLAGEKVYYLGIFYVAPVNINLGGGTPLVNTTWRQIPTWGSYTTTATAAGTTTLDLYSSEIQRFSGVTTQTVVLPVVTTLPALGKPFYIINDSTGTLTVNSSGGNLVATILAGQRYLINCILLTGTTAASWTVSSGTETTTTIGTLIAGATTKATPVDADILALSDSAASNILKGLTWANLKATLLTTWKDATGGLAGLTLFKINFKNAANTFTSFFTNTNTAARTYTFQDRDGTIADDTNLALKANLDSPTFTGTVVIPTPFTLGAVSVLPTGTELNYVDGVTSSIQTQLDAKAPLASPTFTGTVAMNGDLQLAENVSILLDAALSADGKWSGICESGVIGDTTVLFGELLYFKAADSRWWRCDADAEATSGPVKLGVCVVAGTAGDTRTIMLKGKINAASLYPALTIGAPVYLSGTAGTIVVTKPTSGFVRVAGYANTADEIYFNPDTSYYEIGTFTATTTFGGASVGATYSQQTMSYRKQDGNVQGGGWLQHTAKGSSTGVALFNGLPYTVKNGNQFYRSASIGYLDAITFSGKINFYLTNNGTTINIWETTVGGVLTSIDNTDFANGSGYMISFWYETAS